MNDGEWGLFIIGTLMVAFAVWLTFRSIHFKTHGVKTEGRVIEILESYDSEDGTYTYCPVYVFYSPNGSAFTNQDSYYSSSLNYEIGDAIPLLVMPDQPDKARSNRFASFWLLPLAVGIFGLFFFIPGVIYASGEIQRKLKNRY